MTGVRHRQQNRAEGFVLVSYVGAGEPAVQAWARQVATPAVVETAYEGAVRVLPGDWLVRDDLPGRALSVWTRERFERDFEVATEEAVA